MLALADEATGEALELWLVAASGLLVSGLLIMMLKAQVDGMVLQLADAARTDQLTGLLNRRGFEEIFELELERARARRAHPQPADRRPRPVQAGERPASATTPATARSRAPARCSQREKRRIDTLARLGGEEFALIVPDASEQQAFRLAERLRIALRDEFDGDDVAVTISFGAGVLAARTARRART